MSIINVGLIQQLQHTATATEEQKKLGLGYLIGRHACVICGFDSIKNMSNGPRCKTIEFDDNEALSVTEEPQCYEIDED